MQVKVEFLAQARPALGDDILTLVLDPSTTLSAALQGVGGQLDETVRHALFCESGRIRPSVLVLVNGQLVPNCDSRLLTDGDTVSLLTPIGGG